MPELSLVRPVRSLTVAELLEAARFLPGEALVISDAQPAMRIPASWVVVVARGPEAAVVIDAVERLADR